VCGELEIKSPVMMVASPHHKMAKSGTSSPGKKKAAAANRHKFGDTLPKKNKILWLLGYSK
jgi:hypothetical protein